MQRILIEKLRGYIAHNNPDILVSLQGNYSLTQYLNDKIATITPLLDKLFGEGKPGYIVEELCLQEMTADLRPSKYQYVKVVLESEFPSEFHRIAEAGVTTYELINLIEKCNPVFEGYGFSEANEDDRFLRYAIIAEIHDYLN